jgi:hypothetical protein
MADSFKLINKAGAVGWDGLKQDLMSLPKESLVELVNVWLKTFWTNQNYWMVFTEDEFGFEAAARMDEKVWGKTGPIQAYRVKQVLNLGDNVQALATMFKLTAPQWVPAGFEWSITEITESKLSFTVHKCPMGTYRKQNNLELLPCKNISPPLYIHMAKVINEKFKTTCVHAHPDQPIENVMCQWEFTLEG